MTFKRASTDEQKAKRYSEILSAAKKLYSEMSYDKITLVAIAKEAGFTRSNIYKYYKTKEEIFLDILLTDITCWRTELEVKLSDKVLAISDFSAIWAESYRGHDRLLESLTILFVFIEKNVTTECLTDFKLKLKNEMVELTRLTCLSLPALSFEQASDFIIMQMAVANGLHPATTLNEKQKEAARNAGLSTIIDSFEPRLKDIITNYLLGVTG